MNEIIMTAIIGFFTTIAGYIFGNKKSKAEASKLEIENVKDVISVYTTAINDLKKEIKELKEQVEKYQTHIEKLQTELYTLRNQMNPDVRPAL